MSLLPLNTPLGDLKIVEVFLAHDFPVVFAAQSDDGRLFVATWVDERPEENDWLYVPVTPVRYADLRRQVLPLHDLFATPDGGTLFRVVVPKAPADAVAGLTPVRPADIDPALLPAEGIMVPPGKLTDAGAAGLIDSVEQ